MNIFLDLLQEMLLQVTTTQVQGGPKCKLLETVAAELLQARSPYCHPTNSVKALKDDDVLQACCQ